VGTEKSVGFAKLLKEVGLRIKAVGIVTDNRIHSINNIGRGCIEVKWLWTGEEELGKIADKSIM